MNNLLLQQLTRIPTTSTSSTFSVTEETTYGGGGFAEDFTPKIPLYLIIPCAVAGVSFIFAFVIGVWACITQRHRDDGVPLICGRSLGADVTEEESARILPGYMTSRDNRHNPPPYFEYDPSGWAFVLNVDFTIRDRRSEILNPPPRGPRRADVVPPPQPAERNLRWGRHVFV